MQRVRVARAARVVGAVREAERVAPARRHRGARHERARLGGRKRRVAPAAARRVCAAGGLEEEGRRAAREIVVAGEVEQQREGREGDKRAAFFSARSSLAVFARSGASVFALRAVVVGFAPLPLCK